MKYSGREVLELMSKHAKNRNAEVFRILFQQLKLDDLPHDAKIVEFGAGTGEFIDRVRVSEFTNTGVVEADTDFASQLSSRHKLFGSIDEVKDADAIFLIDVLEHLEDDELYLRKFFNALKPDGRLFIYVPAMQHLYSDFDKSIGHYRRYDLKKLSDTIIKSGFRIKASRYHEMAGYFAVLAVNVILRRKIPSAIMVRIYDRLLVPTTNFLERFMKPRFGKSLWVTAVKAGVSC